MHRSLDLIGYSAFVLNRSSDSHGAAKAVDRAARRTLACENPQRHRCCFPTSLIRRQAVSPNGAAA